MPRSPFPGLDPYLEPFWLDVHTALVSEARTALNQQLPEDLIASVEERVAVESEDDCVRVFAPDVRVFEPPAEEPIVTEPPADGAVEAPYRLVAQIEPITERFIRIIEPGTERLVTVVEFVSPTNKREPGLKAFRSKRAELLASGVNFVEVDLVRSGDWRALLRPHRCGRKTTSVYRTTIRAPSDPAAVYLHPITLRRPLPQLTVPLRTQDEKVRLDLQALLDRAYATGRYAQRINYPPLDSENDAWADELLRAAGKR